MKPVVALGILESKYIHSSLAPWCLAAGINTWAPRLQPVVVESTINRPVQELAERLYETAPAVIGLCCYIWNIEQVAELAAVLKAALPNTPLVLGGPEVSYCAAEVFARIPQADYIICGEGEEPFARLCSALVAGRHAEAEAVPGVCTPQKPETEPYTPCGDWPSPYTPAYFTALNGRIAYLETSRGCPFRCAFCLSGRCGGVRFLPLERAEQELLALAASGARTIKLVDRTFNCNRSRALHLWRFILAHYGKEIPTEVCFHFEIGGDLLDEECLAVLAQAPAGSMQLEIGLQSFYEPTLTAIHRSADTSQLCRNIRTLLQPGNLHIHIDLIAGLPLETAEQFAQSFNTAYALQAHQLQLGFLKMLYGAELRNNAEKEGYRYAGTAPYEVLETPWLSEQNLKALHNTEDAVDRLYNSGRFALTLKYVLQATQLSPFALFETVGRHIQGAEAQQLSLDEYTARIQHCFTALPGVQTEPLRDALVCDRLASNSTGRLPVCLQKADPVGLKAAAKVLPPQGNGIRRGLALLYAASQIVWVDYSPEARNPVTGRWPLNFLAQKE